VVCFERPRLNASPRQNGQDVGTPLFIEVPCCFPASREDDDASRQRVPPGSQIRLRRPQGGESARHGNTVVSPVSPALSKTARVFRGHVKARVAKHLSIKGKAQYNNTICLRPSLEPLSNLALNRTRYSIPALGLHFILAQARHASAGRLALR
jgi:hypothetical protein